MKISQYDFVELVDGRRGTVVEIYTKPCLGYEVEFEGCEMFEDHEPDSLPFEPDQIKRVLEHYEP